MIINNNYIQYLLIPYYLAFIITLDLLYNFFKKNIFFLNYYFFFINK